MSKNLIKEQFGANATSYVDSKVHARGSSLTRLTELIQTQPEWQVLDIASATGHTAFLFAPHVQQVWSTDITPEMLDLAREQAKERGLNNIIVEHADAEDMPYTDGSFDLVTCRIAAHHFGDVPKFLREAYRVLRPGGLLAVVDNVVPTGAAGDYINAFEMLRDPSHGRCWSMEEWNAGYREAGFTMLHEEILDKPMEFDFWAKRHDGQMQARLQAMLSQVSGGGADFFQIEQDETGRVVTFHLQEGVLIGQRSTE